MKFENIENAIGEIAEGKPVVLLDDSSGTIASYLVQSAAHCTEEAVNFMAVHCLGVICVGLDGPRADHLQLTPMPGNHDNKGNEGFTISVEAREDVTTGISAADRAKTLQVLAEEGAKAEDLVSPGHIFPVRVDDGGVLHNARPPEAAVELVRLAGVSTVGAYCALLDSTGEVRDGAGGEAFAVEHGFQVVRLSQLSRYRLLREFIVKRVGERSVDTPHGSARLIVFENELDESTHPVFVIGDLNSVEAPPVRIHSQCLTGDAFHSLRCDCGDQLNGALSYMHEQGVGVLVYLRQEGRGIGLTNKVRAYGLQDRGQDTVDANIALGFGADERSYVVASQIFKNLGLSGVRLITNNERKIRETEEWGVRVVERVALDVAIRPENESYLRTKRDRLGHLLSL